MSHELRTPLNGIMGYAQVLQLDEDCTPTQRQGVDIIYRCSEHLLMLIDDILNLSKIEANKVELDPQIFNFSELLQAVSQIFTLKAKQKSITFIYEAVTELPENIFADAKRLQQILINLLNNAIKFTKRGSVILKVEVLKSIDDELQNDRDELAANALGTPIIYPSQKIRFQIEDTGCGIHSEELEKIFLPFEQVGDISRIREGTGLGLAITKSLISLMGSKIFVESAPDVGSKFWFDLDLPVTSGFTTKSTAVKLTDAILGYEGQKRKVLVVDDRWENRSIIINLLGSLGFELAEAADGKAGLNKAVNWQPDLIISDIVMPGKDGFWLVRKLRQLPEFKNTIIIAASASVFNSDRQKCLDLGYSDFIAKPIKVPELLEKIKTYLNLSWIYAPTATPANLTETVLLADGSQETVPPKEELLDLYEAAKGCYVDNVDLEISRLQQLYPESSFFIAKVLELSADFEYQAIVELIEPLIQLTVDS